MDAKVRKRWRRLYIVLFGPSLFIIDLLFLLFRIEGNERMLVVVVYYSALVFCCFKRVPVCFLFLSHVPIPIKKIIVTDTFSIANYDLIEQTTTQQ